MLVRPEFKPATSSAADRRSPNWANQAVESGCTHTTFFDLTLLIHGIGAVCSTQMEEDCHSISASLLTGPFGSVGKRESRRFSCQEEETSCNLFKYMFNHIERKHQAKNGAKYILIIFINISAGHYQPLNFRKNCLITGINIYILKLKNTSPIIKGQVI